MIEATFNIQSRRAIVSFGMSSETLGNKSRASTPDVPDAPDPHSKNAIAARLVGQGERSASQQGH